MRSRLTSALMLLVTGCAATTLDAEFFRASEIESQGRSVVGPADYCGSAVLITLNENERITNLVGTGLHGRVFLLITGEQRIDVAETDIARNVRGTQVGRNGSTQILRSRSSNGYIYVLQRATDGAHVRLQSSSFSGSGDDLPMVRRFRLRTFEEASCSDPGSLF